MASLISSENINLFLEELRKKEKNSETENEQMKDLLKNTSTMEEKWQIIDSLKSRNNVIALIKQERLQVMHIMKIQMKKVNF
jgi:hypothetical protein